jgi:hypothetical protein
LWPTALGESQQVAHLTVARLIAADCHLSQLNPLQFSLLKMPAFMRQSGQIIDGEWS